MLTDRVTRRRRRHAIALLHEHWLVLRESGRRDREEHRISRRVTRHRERIRRRRRHRHRKRRGTRHQYGCRDEPGHYPTPATCAHGEPFLAFCANLTPRSHDSRAKRWRSPKPAVGVRVSFRRRSPGICAPDTARDRRSYARSRRRRVTNSTDAISVASRARTAPLAATARVEAIRLVPPRWASPGGPLWQWFLSP
jgi:hypothetical protein